MNYQRGSKRIGLIAWIIYVLFILTFPFFEANRQLKDALALAYSSHSNCVETNLRDLKPIGGCDAELKSQSDEDFKVFGPLSIYRSMGWNLLWLVPVMIFVPPLILYGMLRGLIALGSWIVRGFREDPGAQI